MNRIATNTSWLGCMLALLATLSIGSWGQTTHQIEINQGTVVYASGNDLVVRMEDGTIRHYLVPGDSKLSVDGKAVSVRDLKSGTKLTQTIITTTEAASVSDVRTVDLKVLEVSPPFLTLASGDTIKHLRVPEGTTFTVDGKEMMLTDLRKDMRVKGTVVTTVPTTVVVQKRKVSGQTPVATPPLVGVLLFEQSEAPKK